MSTIGDILNEIESEALFNYLSVIDKETQNFLLLNMLGYFPSEISKILNLSSSSIYAFTQYKYR